MNMMNTMRRGLATTAISLVCLMAGTMNTLAATAEAGSELVSQLDATAGSEEANGTSAEASQTPSGPASDPELLEKAAVSHETAAELNESTSADSLGNALNAAGETSTQSGTKVNAFSNEASQTETALETADTDADAASESSDSATESTTEASAPAEEAPAEIYAGRFTTTAYCSCRKCCRGGKNRTKSGTVPQAGRTISADLRVFPLGTKLRINGVVYTVEDSGSGIRGNKLDIFFNSHSQALQYGRRGADVYIVR